MRRPKYTTRFESIARCLIDEEVDKFLAKASLDGLAPLLPKDIPWDDKPDLLPIVANGAVVNRSNRNGHLLTYDKAVEVARNTRFNFVDIEHLRKHVVGVIVSTGFSKFGSNEILAKEDIKDLKDPFNLSVAAAIFAQANPKLAEKVRESNDPDSALYQRISLSWEIGFDEYHLLVGNKNLAEGELVTDPKKISELSAYLKTKVTAKNGETKEVKMGWGKMPDGTPIYTVLAGDNIIPVGYGLVMNPAADVKGILTLGDDTELIEEEDSSARETIVLQDSPTKETQAVLLKINEALKLNQDQLTEFSKSLFDMAKERPENTFDKVSAAAIEFSKQGLDSKDVLSRTKDALILVNRSKIDVKDAVAGLTDIIRSFSLSSTEIVDKLAKVDIQFSVSAADLADAFRRVGTSYKTEDIAVKKSATNENSTSHKNQARVNQIEMKIASEAELRAKLSENKVPEEVIASVVEFTAKASSPAVDQMNEALRKANEQYVAEKTSREEKEKAVANLQTEVSTAKAELDKVNKALEELQTTVAEREKQDKFQTRLAGLDSEYNLEDEDRKVITNQIKDLDDTGYESWFGGFKVLAAAKKKVPAKDGEKPGDKKNDKEPDKDMDDKASASKVAEEVIASAKPVSSEVPNTSSTSSLKKKYELSKTAFQVVR